MQESDEPNKPAAALPAEPSPELEVDRLLKLLELQRAGHATRGRHARETMFSGMAFRYLSIILIVAGTVVAVVFMEWMASQISKRPHPDLRPMPPPLIRS